MREILNSGLLFSVLLALVNCGGSSSSSEPFHQEPPDIKANLSSENIIQNTEVRRSGDCKESCEISTEFESDGKKLKIQEVYSDQLFPEREKTDLIIDGEAGFGAKATTRLFSVAPVVQKTNPDGTVVNISSRYFYSAGVYVHEGRPAYYIGVLDYYNYLEDAEQFGRFEEVKAHSSNSAWEYHDIKWFYVKTDDNQAHAIHGQDGQIQAEGGNWNASFDNQNLELTGTVEGMYVYGQFSGTVDEQQFGGEFVGMDGKLMGENQTAGVFGGTTSVQDAAIAGGWFNTEHYMVTHE